MGYEQLDYYRDLIQPVATQLLRCFVLLDEGLYRLGGGGQDVDTILPLKVKGDGVGGMSLAPLFGTTHILCKHLGIPSQLEFNYYVFSLESYLPEVVIGGVEFEDLCRK